jgi:hypothetical protein
MLKIARNTVIAIALMGVGAASAQYPVLDLIANNVVQKYGSATCEQLWQQKGKPKSQQEMELVNMLRNDPHMRIVFINKIAAPVVNKMFECGMIP